MGVDFSKWYYHHIIQTGICKDAGEYENSLPNSRSGLPKIKLNHFNADSVDLLVGQCLYCY